MKIIPKFQQGGNSLFTVYTAVQTPQYPRSIKQSDTDKQSLTVKDSSKSEEKDDSKGKLTEKELFAMIKDIDGLPNEMRILARNLKQTLETERLIGVDTGQLANTYIDNLIKMKIANQNKTRFDEVVKDAKENGSIGEAAITLDGNLLTTDNKGKVRKISVENYLQSGGKYELLTNSNLAWLRKYDPKYAFTDSNNVFEIIQNGMGYESFQALLDKAKGALGNYKYEETGMAGKQALLGLQSLQNMSKEDQQKTLDAALNGIYEYTASSTSNEQQVMSLINYLSTALPKRAKVWASLKMKIPDQEKATKALVGEYLKGQLNIDKKYNVKYLGTEDELTKGKNKSDLDNINMNTPMKFLEGQGVRGEYILNPGTSRAIHVSSSTMPLTDSAGKPIGVNSTFEDAAGGEYNGILDLANVTIAGHIIDSSRFGGIILKDGKISSIDYPCIIKDNGEIIPNTSPKLAKAKQDAERLLKQKGVDVTNPDHIKKYWKAINLAYKKFGLPEAYNEHGDPIGTWRRFGVVNVYTSDKVVGLDDMDDNPLLKEITDDSTIDNLVEITKDKNFSKKGFFNSITGSYNRFYEGTLWVPIDVNYQSAGITTNMNGKQNRAIEEAQQARDVRANWKKPPTI